jgi:hypothetical protein
VYLPCILQTKKRYVGYMYETRDQLKPEYDAKGIETVRYSLKKLHVNAINTTNKKLIPQNVQVRLWAITSAAFF